MQALQLLVQGAGRGALLRVQVHAAVDHRLQHSPFKVCACTGALPRPAPSSSDRCWTQAVPSGLHQHTLSAAARCQDQALAAPSRSSARRSCQPRAAAPCTPAGSAWKRAPCLDVTCAWTSRQDRLLKARCCLHISHTSTPSAYTSAALAHARLRAALRSHDQGRRALAVPLRRTSCVPAHCRTPRCPRKAARAWPAARAQRTEVAPAWPSWRAGPAAAMLAGTGCRMGRGTCSNTSGAACVPRLRQGWCSSAALLGCVCPAAAILAAKPRVLSACASHTLHRPHAGSGLPSAGNPDHACAQAGKAGGWLLAGMRQLRALRPRAELPSGLTPWPCACGSACELTRLPNHVEQQGQAATRAGASVAGAQGPAMARQAASSMGRQPRGSPHMQQGPPTSLQSGCRARSPWRAAQPGQGPPTCPLSGCRARSRWRAAQPGQGGHPPVPCQAAVHVAAGVQPSQA